MRGPFRALDGTVLNRRSLLVCSSTRSRSTSSLRSKNAGYRHLGKTQLVAVRRNRSASVSLG